MERNETSRCVGFFLVSVGMVAFLIFGVNATGPGPVPEEYGWLLPSICALIGLGISIFGCWMMPENS